MKTTVTIVLVLALGCGGAHRPRARYAPQPTPSVANGPPKQLDLGTITQRPMPLASPQAQKEPDTEDLEAEKTDVLNNAVEDAVRTVLDGSFKGAVHEWPYKEGEIYEVLAQLGATTTIQLEPGEEKTAPVMVGNARGWGEVQYVQGGDSHGHIVRSLVFRPGRLGPDSDVTIFTTLRTLHILMRRVDAGESYVRRVRFRMLELEREQLVLEQRTREEAKRDPKKTVDSGCTSGQYETEVVEGSPTWVPTLVWRTCEGAVAKVHIQFRPDVQWSQVPALTTDGGVANYGFDPKEHVMEVGGLFRKAVLSLGSDKTGYERVKIRALKDPR